MAATKTVLRLTNNSAIVRIVATAASDTATISLATDLKMTNETQSSPTATIPAVFYSTGSNVTLTRNSVVVGNFYGNGEFEDPEMCLVDQASSDIVVTFAAAGTAIVKIRKTSGYTSPFQPEQFGAYDDPTSTTA
jgi:hypothetical protein